MKPITRHSTAARNGVRTDRRAMTQCDAARSPRSPYRVRSAPPSAVSGAAL
ncbi:hypothetical protein EYF80_006764 [Liparis tanakae]|uniref:Uncharacterized protein n=1 Tax=Liparis tanakae TaxID=230148 RepID=A0A4Z2IZH2_9TELE|nr:hypothetical protein EYF80_006764 [Liparis tanakae]